MKFNPKVALIVIALLLIVILVGVVFIRNFELVIDENEISFSGEAWANPFFTMRQFLRAMGYDARVLEPESFTTNRVAEADTIIILDSRVGLSRRQQDALLDWADGGGHLIVSPDVFRYAGEEPPTSDPLLESLGIYANWLDPEEDDGAYICTTLESMQMSFSDNFFLETTPGPTLSMRDEYLVDQYLVGHRPEDGIAENCAGTQIIRRLHGDGLVTVVSDFYAFDNWSITDEKHPELLRAIVGNRKTSHQLLWLIDDIRRVSVLRWLLNQANAKTVVLAGSLLLLLWLAASFFRFGPTIAPESKHRRKLMEHIEAAGRFDYQHRRTSLLQRVRQATLQEINRKLPGYGQMDSVKQKEALLQHAKITPAHLDVLYSDPGEYSAQNFTAIVKTLEQIRKAL